MHLLGYASKYKGYICYEVAKKKVYISRHVLFDESEFPYQELIYATQKPSNSLSLTMSNTSDMVPNLKNVLVTPQSSVSNTSTPSESSPSNTDGSSPTASISVSSIAMSSPIPNHVQSIIATEQNISAPDLVVSEFQPESLQVIISIPPLNLHPMQTRSKSGILKMMALLSNVHENGRVDLTSMEPTTYKFALNKSV